KSSAVFNISRQGVDPGLLSPTLYDCCVPPPGLGFVGVGSTYPGFVPEPDPLPFPDPLPLPEPLPLPGGPVGSSGVSGASSHTSWYCTSHFGSQSTSTLTTSSPHSSSHSR